MLGPYARYVWASLLILALMVAMIAAPQRGRRCRFGEAPAGIDCWERLQRVRAETADEHARYSRGVLTYAGESPSPIPPPGTTCPVCGWEYMSTPDADSQTNVRCACPSHQDY